MQDRAKQCWSRIHESTTSLRFLGIILRALIRKLLRRIRKEYFAVYGEYADRHKIESILSQEISVPKKKNSDHKSPLKTWPNGQKIIRYCPFNESVIFFPAPDPDAGISKPKMKKKLLLFVLSFQRCLAFLICKTAFRRPLRTVYTKNKPFVYIERFFL